MSLLSESSFPFEEESEPEEESALPLEESELSQVSDEVSSDPDESEEPGTISMSSVFTAKSKVHAQFITFSAEEQS